MGNYVPQNLQFVLGIEDRISPVVSSSQSLTKKVQRLIPDAQFVFPKNYTPFWYPFSFHLLLTFLSHHSYSPNQHTLKPQPPKSLWVCSRQLRYVLPPFCIQVWSWSKLGELSKMMVIVLLLQWGFSD